MAAPYTPNFDAAMVEQLRRWHEAAYEELRAAGTRSVSYLGLDLVVPPEVFPPTPVSDLLGQAVLDEVRSTDRVLDMGTGSGVNAILAARRAREVVGVDINPHAVAAATDNARRNGVAGNTTFVEGDLFDVVTGTFDLVVYDPPFRWFRPRDLLEVAMADEGYASLGRFMGRVPDFLAPGGRVLLFFGTSGDMQHLSELIDRAGLQRTTVAERDLTKDGLTVTYVTFRLSRPDVAEYG